MSDDARAAGRPVSFWENLSKGLQNALEIARVGRLSPEVHAPYSVVRREPMYKLRRYERTGAPSVDAPLVLVPPLMVTPEVYDIDPPISALRLLAAAGVDSWVVDFGIPEQEEGGLARTLDDHVRAIDQAIDHVRAVTGRDVHLAGYSQGGMFIYQAAAYRHGAGILSIITFGAPVDLHRNLILRDELATRMIDALSGSVRVLLDAIEGLPGAFSSIGFRVLSLRKELKQLISFVSHLHDREALMRGESSRRFLHGEGFVYWPGPALRTFYEEFVVDNRLTQGGFVIDGRSLTLADISCPILYFYGERDEFARAPSVRAIREAAPLAPTYEVALRTGHFGLVVGSVAIKHTWPISIAFMRWLEGKAARPPELHEAEAKGAENVPIEQLLEQRVQDVEYNTQLLIDTARGTAQQVRKTLSGVSERLMTAFDNLRYQLPRLSRLSRIEPSTRISVGHELADQAARIGAQTFFLWQGRAHTYADADRRVDNIVRGLLACELRPGMRVGILMRARPTYLSLVAALSRLGAVAVLLSPEPHFPLAEALQLGAVSALLCDPDHAETARATFAGPVLVLGGGAADRELVPGVVDMERIDPSAVPIPAWYVPNPGRAEDLALILFTLGNDGRPRSARISNRRWAIAAYGAAAASTLTAKDTVYCCMPLHHPAGLLVAVGGALVGGARLALAGGFSPARFWSDVRRSGASVVFYAGEMCRALVDAPPRTGDEKNPVRLFAGSGMRRDVWNRLEERFNTGVLEFYATTEGSAVLANVSGHKVGAVGKPLPGTAAVMLAAYDFEQEAFVRGPDGWLVHCAAGQPGMLIARIEPGDAQVAGDEGAGETRSARRLLRSALEPGDLWFVTGDVLRTDHDGDHWFIDRAADMIRTPKGPISTSAIEDALYELGEVQQAAAYGVALPGLAHPVAVVTLVLRSSYTLDPVVLARHLESRLDVNARPRFVRLEAAVPLSVGYRPLKQLLRARPLEPESDAASDAVSDTEGATRSGRLLAYDHELRLFAPATREHFALSIAQARSLEDARLAERGLREPARDGHDPGQSP